MELKNKLKNTFTPKLRKFTKHPYFKFIMFGVALFILQSLSAAGVLQFSFGLALTQTMIYSIVAVGFSYLLGYAGLASLGTAGFVGLGAYTVSIFLRNYTSVPYLVVLLIVLLISLIIGIIVGFISLRIEGLFLAIVTLGLSEVLYQVFLNGGVLTGGPNGTNLRGYPNIFGLQLDRTMTMYMVLIFLIALLIVTYNLINSPTGRAMLAMKNSTSAAQAMGISLMKYRLLAFVLSTMYAGLAGALFMSFVRYTDPYSYTIMFSLNILAACIFGGTRNLWGVMAGTLLVFGLVPMFLQDVTFLRTNSWLFNVIIGGLLILIVLFYKGGVVQLFTNIKYRFKKSVERARVKKYGYD